MAGDHEYEVPEITRYAREGQCAVCKADAPDAEPALYKFQGRMICGDCIPRMIRNHELTLAFQDGEGDDDEEEGGDPDDGN